MSTSERSIDFGAKMKRLREERGVGLREIAEATKISVSALESLERNDVSRLPGGIFLRGIVRAYAAQIGVDPDNAMRDFSEGRALDSVAGGPHAQGSERSAAGQRTLRMQIVAAVVVIILVALAVAWLRGTR